MPPPFNPVRPLVGMKIFAVASLDSYQDDVQELAGGRPTVPGTDEPVAVSRPVSVVMV